MPISTATAGFLQPLSQERTFLWCVLASIALHALVLLGMSRHEAPAPPAKTLLVLTARLASVATVPQPASPAPQPERAAPKVPEPAPAPRPVLTKPLATPAPAPPAPAAPSKPVAPDAAPTPPSAAESAAQASPPAQAKSLPQSPAGAPGPEAAARPGSEADAGTRDQYRLALIMATKRYKRYPAIAMEKGWQGRVEVHLVIGANGMIASTAIKSSSGHEILDNQALDMLKKGKTTVPIPAGLRGREFDIDVPVIFNLDNPNS